MSIKDDVAVLIERGLVEVFVDPDGAERIRLTPAGARQQGDELLALLLECCRMGFHRRCQPDGPFCYCGERRFDP